MRFCFHLPRLPRLLATAYNGSFGWLSTEVEKWYGLIRNTVGLVL